MKKPKVLAKFKGGKKPPASEQPVPPERVTNDSVSKHRDEMLNKGRRFKYPFYRSKHRIAIISIIVVVASVVLLGGFMVLRLYKWQDTSTFSRSVTRILPFPVARVNDDFTSYESYLFELGSSIHWQEKYGTTDLNSPDGKRQIEYLKRSALDKAEMNTIAHSLADKNDISVSDEEIDAVVARIGSTGGDLSKILGEQFAFTEGELRRYLENSILREKVAHELDKEAPERAKTIRQRIKSVKNFGDIAKKYSEDLETKQIAGDIGVVEKGRANLPNEVSEMIFKMKKGQISDVISTDNDYYIVALNEKVDENRARVSIIRIKVKDMKQYLSEYREQDKVSEYIKLEETTEPQQAE